MNFVVRGFVLFLYWMGPIISVAYFFPHNVTIFGFAWTLFAFFSPVGPTIAGGLKRMGF